MNEDHETSTAPDNIDQLLENELFKLDQEVSNIDLARHCNDCVNLMATIDWVQFVEERLRKPTQIQINDLCTQMATVFKYLINKIQLIKADDKQIHSLLLACIALKEREAALYQALYSSATQNLASNQHEQSMKVIDLLEGRQKP